MKARFTKGLARIATGGVMFGWLQALGAVDFSSILQGLLSSLLNVLVVLLTGGSTSVLQDGLNSGSGSGLF